MDAQFEFLEHHKFSGMTLRERLQSAGLMEQWEAAIISGNRARMVGLLGIVDLADVADCIVETVFQNPQRYGSRKQPQMVKSRRDQP